MSSNTVDLIKSGSNNKIFQLDDDDDDLLTFRHVKKPVSTIGSFFNFLKGHLGAGVLSLPFAFSNAGILLGSILTVLIGLVYGHCVYMVIRTSQKLCQKLETSDLNYAQTAEKAFMSSKAPWMQRYSKVAKIFVECGLMGSAFNGSIIMTFAATTFQGIFKETLNIDWDVRIFILLVAIPEFIVSQIRYLKFLAPISAMANVFILTTLAIVLIFIFSEPLDVQNATLIGNVTNWPTFLSIVAFAFSGMGIVLPVEHSMKRPKNFLGCPGIAYIAIGSLICIYTFIGVSGYVRYGSKIEGSISLNLPKNEALSIVSQCLMSAALVLTIGIVFQYFMGILWNHLEHRISEKRHKISQIGIRFLITAIMLVLALVIPNIGILISIIGAVVASSLSFLFPPAIHIAYIYPNFGKLKWKLWKNLTIMVFALFILISGVYFGVLDIIGLYRN